MLITDLPITTAPGPAHDKGLNTCNCIVATHYSEGHWITVKLHVNLLDQSVLVTFPNIEFLNNVTMRLTFRNFKSNSNILSDSGLKINLSKNTIS